MNLKLSKKLEKESRGGGDFKELISDFNITKVKKEAVKSLTKNGKEIISISKWNFIVPLILLTFFLIIVFSSLFNLQVVNGSRLYERSVNNKLETITIPAKRGVIFDRNGVKLAENIPSINVSLDLRDFKVNGDFNYEEMEKVLSTLEEILPEKYTEESSLKERVFSVIDSMNPTERVLAKSLVLARAIDNQTAIQIKSQLDTLDGIDVDDGSKRLYPKGIYLSHIVGYTGDVYVEDLEKLDYIKFNDVIGRSGIEKSYDRDLFGKDGSKVREVDNLGNIVSDSEVVTTEPVSGSTLHITIDSRAQEKMYKVLEKGVKDYGATGAVGILQDVNSGELLVLSSYPSYDANKFIGGISDKDFNKLLNNKQTPLNNRAIAAQIPPGSTFKPLVAAAILDAKVVTRNSIYVSRPGYTFSNGARFQEFGDRSYGPLNIVDALSVSSNIYFCEAIRNWNMNKLVPYLESFGIGSYTYVDIPGEGPGMLPSPENKAMLAKSISPWLDPIWYPEGDSCNSVIGQGITTVTPIQMSNWVSAIANGGTLNTPHVGKKIVDANGEERTLTFDPLKKNFVSKDALRIVREGMWASVNGSRRVIFPLTDAKVEVAAKTGTAEFGRLNSKGQYEHTHAWVTGFFPYNKPKYSFVVLLEDGGQSYNAAAVAREFIDWWVDYSTK